jgi:hypothetical protein
MRQDLAAVLAGDDDLVDVDVSMVRASAWS